MIWGMGVNDFMVAGKWMKIALENSHILLDLHEHEQYLRIQYCFDFDGKKTKLDRHHSVVLDGMSQLPHSQ